MTQPKDVHNNDENRLDEALQALRDETDAERRSALATLLRYLNRATTTYLRELANGIEQNSPDLTRE